MTVWLTFYRGITVAADDEERVCSNILSSGLTNEVALRARVHADISSIKQRASTLLTDIDLCRTELDQLTARGAFACGDRTSASYYAQVHNAAPSLRRDRALLVTFRRSSEHVYVDGRDFLVNAFQLFDRDSPDHVVEQNQLLKKLYGPASVDYFEANCRTAVQRDRIVIGNLCCFDPEVIAAHYSNQTVIVGRNRIPFSSAFCVAGPILPEDILAVERLPIGGQKAVGSTLNVSV
jgi:hypothetical protein